MEENGDALPCMNLSRNDGVPERSRWTGAREKRFSFD
jgi:hypothetical protein